ncbi:MAG: 2Fe-2S iron-sulfur cluster-binding protein [Polaromonas sp.]
MHITDPSPATPKQAFPADADHAVFKVRIEPGGGTFDAPATLPLLQAAELAGVQMLASSCRNGTCRTCLCQSISGRVAYRIEWPGLSADEKREGFILPCVAYAQSDLVIELPF